MTVLNPLVWPGLITVLALVVYFAITLNVGRARQQYKVPPPQVTGSPEFERALRVQQNTVEQMVFFLPLLWLFSIFLNPAWGAAFGALWVVGRVVYALGYYQAAENRLAGFAISQLAGLALLVGAVVGLSRLVRF